MNESMLLAYAEMQEKFAEASPVDWLSRLLRAQAGFTRDLAAATAKFQQQLHEEM